jgi:ATP-dependent Clp protease ATP-binding subunit ClpB
VVSKVLQRLEIDTGVLSRRWIPAGRLPRVQGGQVSLSRDLQQAMAEARRSRAVQGRLTWIRAPLLGILSLKQDDAAELLRPSGVRWTAARGPEGHPGRPAGHGPRRRDRYRVLEKYAVDPDRQGRQGKLEPVIGRDDEIPGSSRSSPAGGRTTRCWSAGGVGKTPRRGLALRNAKGDVPEPLRESACWHWTWVPWSPAPSSGGSSRTG